jgi:Amiloride-sensitive sodium channel
MEGAFFMGLLIKSELLVWHALKRFLTHFICTNRKLQTIAKSMLCHKHDLVELYDYDSCHGCLDAIREIIVPIDEMFAKCTFRNRVIKCSEHFIETIYDNRLCYVFNELGVYRKKKRNTEKLNEDWSIDTGYKPTASVDAYPHRAIGAGPKFGLSLLLKSDRSKLDKFCSLDSTYLVGFPLQIP